MAITKCDQNSCVKIPPNLVTLAVPSLRWPIFHQIWRDDDLMLYEEKGPRFAAFSKIWLLIILRLLPFILRTNFRRSIKSWGFV